MPLPKHIRDEDGRYRQERSDSLAKNLAQDYPEFKNVNPNKKLGTIRKETGEVAMNKVRAVLRKLNK